MLLAEWISTDDIDADIDAVAYSISDSNNVIFTYAKADFK